MLGKVFVTEGEDETGSWRKPRTVELHDIYRSLNIVSRRKS